MTGEEQFERIDEITIKGLELDSGKAIPEVLQVYAMYGSPAPDGSNVILVCHAMTGSHHLSGPAVPGLPDAWFGPLVGPGRALDTKRLCVICVNNLCSPYGSSSPMSVNSATGHPWAMTFPVITPRDVARAQKRALEAIGVRKIRMALGGSFGGMIAIEHALSFPGDVSSCGVIAAPTRLYPQAIAYNEVQRKAILSDPDWAGGDYYPGQGPVSGLATARMLAMITYRSEQNFNGRWMRSMADDSADRHEWGSKFKVESYLDHHGSEIVSRFDANCYLYTTRAMDLHDVGAGRGGIERAFAALADRDVLAVGISSDILFPNWQVMEVARLAGKSGARAAYEEIDSDNGHDAFLIDFDQLDEILRFFFKQKGI
ncbi:MAG: homoserine O-acetyltransferase [Synergistaceae bacterium]|jgi:homoserine O-acetyltransferase|nr:homoserine O-acetyltransferase [Synergistaceae bacterium]